MPVVKDGESEKDFVQRCIPFVLKEGTTTDGAQAAAICHSLYRKHAEGKSMSIKQGARHSGKDMQDIQNAHDALCRLGAKCAANDAEDAQDNGADEGSEGKSSEFDTLISYGGEVKSLGGGKFGGKLIRYSDSKSTDLTGDFFDPTADYGIEDGQKIPVYFNHRQPIYTKDEKEIIIKKKIGQATVHFSEDGILLDAIIFNREQYEKEINLAGLEGKLSWSSGSAAHLVDREKVGKSYRITAWPIVEASLTPTPAEPRNSAIPLKALIHEHVLAGRPALDRASALSEAEQREAEIIKARFL